MTVSSVVLALNIKPDVVTGFWISNGATLRYGPMLTLTQSFFSAFNSGISLIFAFTLGRLAQILSFFLFLNFFERTKHSMQESQYAAMVVNVKGPLAVLLASWGMRRGGAKRTLGKIVTVAFIFWLAHFAIPPIVSKFPTVDQGLAQSYWCEIPSLNQAGAFLLQDDSTYFPSYNAWADAAFASLDRNTTDTPKKINKKFARALPAPTFTYIPRCPAGATCHPTYQFTIFNNYTLSSKEFGFNTKLRFSLNVSETCYRPPDAIAPLNLTSSPIPYGLLYGPESLPDASYPNATDIFYKEQGFSGGYGLSSYAARADDFVQSFWKPNASLVLGGDTTILFYRVGGVLMTNKSVDPIFATGTLQSGLYDNLYNSSSIVSPILCDTKYVFCTDTGDCSPAGGVSSLRNWMGKKSGDEWSELTKFFTVTLFSPPIYMASAGINAIVAAESAVVLNGIMTQGNLTVNVTQELSRLSNAGRAMIASNPQLMAYGLWSSPTQPPAFQSSLCGKSIVDHQNIVTIYLLPYIAIFSLSIIIIALSYPQYTLPHIWNWKEYEDAWKLYEVGQLHRQMVEQVGGPLENVDMEATWPVVKDGPPGLAVVNENGIKRFGPAFSNEKDSRGTTTPVLPELPFARTR